MKDLIAKRYVEALIEGSKKADLKAFQTIFSTIATALEDEKLSTIFYSPYMTDEKRVEILLASVENVKSDKIDNIIKLLVEKRRVEVIGEMADSLALILSNESKSYEGVISSNSAIKKDVAKNFETSIGAKLDSKIKFKTTENEYNGVKVEVEDLGIEVSFSKSNVRNQMIQHILKSI